MTVARNGDTRRARYWTVLPWVVLALGIPASILLFTVIRDAVESVARLRFERQASDAKSIIEGRVQFYADILYALRALFITQGPVSRLQFHRFVESLDLKHRYPGFDALNYAAYVPAKDRKRFEEAVRRDTSLDPRGYPRFAIKPSGERPEYFVIVYLEPMAGFDKFGFGLDISVNPAQAADPRVISAIQRYVRDTGKLTASGVPIQVRTGESQYTGLAMRLAVYRSETPIDTVEQRRAAYLGSVGAGFNVENLMKDVLDEKMLRYMRFTLYDAGPTFDRPDFPSSSGKRLLFDSTHLIQGPTARAPLDDPSLNFAHILPIEIAGRIWEIHFSAPKNASVDPTDRLLPSMVLAGGLLSSALLFSVFYSLASSRRRAVEIAEVITKDLRDSEERFRLITENASDLITLLDPQGKRVYLNPAYGRLFGDHKALMDTDAFQVIHPEDRDRMREVFKNTVRNGTAWRTELRFLLPGGEARHIESRGSAVRNPNGDVALVVVVARDVTERQRTEEALRARDLQLQEAQEIANLGSWEWDVREDSVKWSNELFRIFGIAHDQFQPTLEGFLALVHPEDREQVAAGVKAVLNADTEYESPFRIIRPDGAVRMLYARGQLVRDESDQPLRLLGVCQDITERIWAEEQVRTTQERFRTMVENVRDYAIFMLDQEGYVTSWNVGAQRIKGYDADEIFGRHYSCFFLPEHASRGDPSRQLRIAAVEGRYESESWRVRKDGRRFWAHVIVMPQFDESGKLTGFSNITRDITERKRAEEDLHSYADRLRSTARRLVEVQESERRTLARELHDRVGQNLTALGLNLRLVASGLASDARPDVSSRLGECDSLVMQTVDAIRDVMGELRPQALDEYGLLAALRSLAASFSRRTGVQVAVAGDRAAGRVPKTVDLAMFRIVQEALNNVAKHSKASRAEISFSSTNGYAALTVRDDGIGFDPKHVEASNPNAGWGLLIMRERAEAVGARFDLDASPGAGVRVLVEYHL